MFVGPDFFQPGDGRCRQIARIGADERGEGLSEIARRDALQVQERDQHIETFRAARIGRQDRRRKADALFSLQASVTDTRLAHADEADTSRDLAFRQMAVAHQPPMAILGQLVSVRFKKTRDFGFDSLSEEAPCALPQHSGQRIGKLSWLSQFDDIILGDGVSLLQWRSGGLDTPMIRRLSPSPSPTSAYSSDSLSSTEQDTAPQLS